MSKTKDFIAAELSAMSKLNLYEGEDDKIKLDDKWVYQNPIEQIRVNKILPTSFKTNIYVAFQRDHHCLKNAWKTTIFLWMNCMVMMRKKSFCKFIKCLIFGWKFKFLLLLGFLHLIIQAVIDKVVFVVYKFHLKILKVIFKIKLFIKFHGLQILFRLLLFS